MRICIHMLRLLDGVDTCIAARMAGRRASLLDVVERVLRDVPNSRIGMLPHGTGSRLDLAREALDQGGLARAVRADAGHS